jgi:hypothetical protein
MKPKDFPVGPEYIPETPERNLWLAVVERALKDYCFFFDQLTKTSNGHVIDVSKLQMHHRNSFNLKAIAELNRLRWFLFDKTPTPFNFEYICQELYSDGKGLADEIRKQASQQFKLHFDETTQKGTFAAIRDYISDTTKIAYAEPAKVESPLRHKRYRITH